jgi:hypothetical protein
MFPNLEKLANCDSENDYRVGYSLEELRHLAPTLAHLAMHLSMQWMGEGHDVLAPISSSKQLRQLYLSRRRDGFTLELKCIEGLHLFECVYYHGTNEMYFDEPGTLEISQLTQLKCLVFNECNFSSVTECSSKAQSLILPRELEEVTFVTLGGAMCTDQLRKELADSTGDFGFIREALSGPFLQVNLTDNVSCSTFWDTMRSRSGPSYPKSTCIQNPTWHPNL